jgi:hypothetical protein
VTKLLHRAPFHVAGCNNSKNRCKFGNCIAGDDPLAFHNLVDGRSRPVIRLVREIVVRRSKLVAAAAAVTAVCASGAAQAAHVGVYVGADAPAYYAQVPYYQPAPPPPPQYIQQGPDGQPEVVPGPDGGPPPYPPGAAPQYAPDGSTGYPPGTAPQYPAGTAPQYAPGAPAPAPGDEDDDDAPQYQPGAAPQTVTPQASGDTWYFCDANKTYYPYVKNCPSGWRPVPAQPAQQ